MALSHCPTNSPNLKAATFSEKPWITSEFETKNIFYCIKNGLKLSSSSKWWYLRRSNHAGLKISTSHEPNARKVKFKHSLANLQTLPSFCKTVMLSVDMICTQTDKQMSAKVLKITSVVVPATSGVSRTTDMEQEIFSIFV